MGTSVPGYHSGFATGLTPQFLMKLIRKFNRWVRGLWQSQARKQKIDEELHFHLEQAVAQNLAAGMSPDEAARAARKRFGNLQSVREQCRETSGASFGEATLQDIRFGLRMLRKNPGFTAVAVLTLALGIGATTAIFSVAYGVLISPYPYAKPHEIWVPGLRSAGRDQKMRRFRMSEIEDLAKLSAYSDVMATTPGSVLLTGEYSPESVTGIRVTGNAFRFIGVAPLFGRGIQPSDISSGGVPELVTVLSYKRWQRLFGSDTNVLGRTLRLDDQPHTIVGVMPPRFGWWTDDGVWLPLGTGTRDATAAFPIARLKPGVPTQAAEQQLNGFLQEQAKVKPEDYPKESFAATLSNYLDMTVASGEMQRSLSLLFGAVGFLLLIACANVANLQLARATVRAREMAIRLSIGAGRGRLVRQLLTESVLLSSLAGILGLAFAVAITRMMVTLMPGFYIPNEARIELNGYVLCFCISISMVTGILFGLVPALQSSKPNLSESLKEDARGSGALVGGRLRAGLVVTEVALAMVLLVSGGLTLRSFIALQKVDVGFHSDQVITVGFRLPNQRYATWEQRNRFAEELLQSARNLPGVQAAEVGNGGLPFGGPRSNFVLDGQAASEESSLFCNLVSADYLKTLGIRLVSGKMLDEAEVRRADRVAVVNEAAAKLWPADVNPIGKRIQLDLLKGPGSQVLAPSNASPYVTVIGIVGNTRNDGVRNESKPAVLIPYTLLAPPDRTLAIRTTANSATLMNALQARVRQMDPLQPLQSPRTFEEALLNQSLQPRFTMALFCLFAGFGLTLATMGIYSVLSYLVTRRTREIGIRAALGAQRRDIMGLVFKSGGRLVGAGIVVGILISLAATRLLGSQVELYQITATDPVTFCSVVILLGAITSAACFIPARRAARVDPTVALRTE